MILVMQDYVHIELWDYVYIELISTSYVHSTMYVS